MSNDREFGEGTRSPAYFEYLMAQQMPLWKRVLKVQLPYRLHLQFLNTGKTLDVGCGIGRNLAFLNDGFGVDNNSNCVDICRMKGLAASSPEDFHAGAESLYRAFDTILFSHILEHMSLIDAKKILMDYIPYLRLGGKIVIIAPQEAGYRSDFSHVNFFDFELADFLLKELGAIVVKRYSFPFPRVFGKIFRYNEFVIISEIAN